MNSSRSVRCLAVVLLVAGVSQMPAAEIRMARHPDYSEGKIAFSYLGDIWLANDDGTNPRRMTTHAARDPTAYLPAAIPRPRRVGTILTQSRSALSSGLP